MRLQAFLARAGVAPSRRKAESLISAGRVSVNGATAELGAKVSGEDEVALDGATVFLPDSRVYLALNKPSGYLTTTSDDRGRPTVLDLVSGLAAENPGLVPAGRLDLETSGLLILTNDGDFAHHITHPSSEIEKEYELTVAPRNSHGSLDELAAGPNLEDGPMLPPRLRVIGESPESLTLRLTIHEGRNRIIRRACAAVGLELLSLKRVRIGAVELADLATGDHRPLSKRERTDLS